MKHIPILFSTPMVQAILDGRKTQTRRVVKDKYLVTGYPRFSTRVSNTTGVCPYGQPGDILWVRETWTKIRIATGEQFIYRADDDFYKDYVEEWHGWRPSIYMPKEACRLFLKVKSVRVERLQDISEEDAIAEGVEVVYKGDPTFYKNYLTDTPLIESAKGSFISLWRKINNESPFLIQNPWVWVVEFERVERPEGLYGLAMTDKSQFNPVDHEQMK